MDPCISDTPTKERLERVEGPAAWETLKANSIGSHEQQGVADEQSQLKELGSARMLNDCCQQKVTQAWWPRWQCWWGGLEICNLTEALNTKSPRACGNRWGHKSTRCTTSHRKEKNSQEQRIIEVMGELEVTEMLGAGSFLGYLSKAFCCQQPRFFFGELRVLRSCRTALFCPTGDAFIACRP